MSELTPHQQKALTITGHLALTANAGSGKTFVLARKYLSVLLNDNIEVSNIAAITFTEKAASELYYKISLLIDDKIKSALINSGKKKLEKIRRQLVSANISTIHSFCIDILKQYPVEARLDARFIPIDENLSNELIELSVDEVIRSAFDDDLIKEDLKYLIRIFASKSRLTTELVKLIKDRKNVFTVKENIYLKDEKHIQEYFTTMFNKYFLLIWKKSKEKFISALEKINFTVAENDSKNKATVEIKNYLQKLKTETEISSIIFLINQIKLLAFTNDITIKKRGYLKSDVSESLLVEINSAEDLMADLIKFELPSDHKNVEYELAKFGLIILNFFNQALLQYESKKKNEGFIDFEDILLHTKLLLQNESVQKSLSNKYSYIMVDEFQDTNEIQYNIFLPILDYLKNGKLFIVGDEKQSIYKFRDAEIEIFNRTRDNIKSEAGFENLLNLPDSFRMTPAICTFTNFVFKKLFSYPEELFGEVPQTDLVCARTDNIFGKVELLIAKTSKDKQEIEESELVAKKILTIIKDGKYSFNDICILVRKRKNFDELEKAFLKYKIPYTIIGGRGFYQRQTISDVYSYLSFLIDINNEPALVGILRSPFFSVSDSILFEISLEKENNFWRKFKSFAKGKKDLENYVTQLEENIELSNSIELPHLLKKLFTDQNYLAVVASRLDGEQELANLEKLISIARNFNSKGFRNLYDFTTYLKDSIIGLEDEAQASFSTDKNTVQLMTIHQSKGLEFPIVFIYKNGEPSLSSILKSGQIQVDKNLGLLSKLPVDDKYLDEYRSAPIISIHNFLESKKNLAELKRLLYVAVTRAKDELYLSASIEESKSFNKDSFFALLSEGLNSKFDCQEFVIKDSLDFLFKDNEVYKNKTELIEVMIPVISQIDYEQVAIEEKTFSQKEFITEIEKLKAQEKGEIISASKVSIFHQCPLKYFLTYEYGFSKLNTGRLNYRNKLRNLNDLNLPETDDEDDEQLDLSNEQETNLDFNAADYGKIVHSILEKDIALENLPEYLKDINNFTDGNSFINNLNLDKLKSDLTKYFHSNTYKKIKRYFNFKNEFEIYVKEEDYYLHGIIDKIIFDGKKILVFDYKTDDIDEKKIAERGKYYLIQLKFYLYIASKLFKGYDNFEGNLIFIKYPDQPVKILFDNSEINTLQKEIASVIKSLRQKNNNKNITHCPTCVFSGFTNKCIIN